MNIIIVVLNIVSYVSVVLFIFTFLWGVIMWFKGILPVLIRIGNGLAKKEIVVFAKGDNLDSLKNLLLDSGIFNNKKIYSVSSKGDIGIAEEKKVYLLFWHDWAEDIDEILNIKKDSTALIIYAPQEKGFIPKETLAKLNEKRNVMISNFRGRLLNDITTSIITTNYK